MSKYVNNPEKIRDDLALMSHALITADGADLNFAGQHYRLAGLALQQAVEYLELAQLIEAHELAGSRR